MVHLNYDFKNLIRKKISSISLSSCALQYYNMSKKEIMCVSHLTLHFDTRL